VLWILSEVWFLFLIRRLMILDKIHKTIYRLQPPNYGVISGLFAYLLQSVIFTPPVVNTYIRESLAALQYRGHCNHFGMFFLDTLDLGNWSCMIDGILKEDDDLVKHILGPLLKKPRHRDEDQEADTGYDDIQYPIGLTPTWSEITASIESDPTVLIPRWEGLHKDYSNSFYGTEGQFDLC
jgi:hypothetical protein